MKRITPAPIKGQELNLNLGGKDNSKKPKHFHSGKNGKATLDELAKKWVPFGCADTPNEALRMLLDGCNE